MFDSTRFTTWQWVLATFTRDNMEIKTKGIR